MTQTITARCFIVGAERSGSTLLRLALDGHSALSFPQEYDFITLGIGEDGTPMRVDSYRELLRSNATFRRSRLEIDERLDLAALNESFLLQRLRGRRVAGGSVHGRFSRLLHFWPEARFIFLVRDPRPQTQSVVRMGWAGNVWRAVEPWLVAQREWAHVIERTQAGRRTVVRYEDLAREPRRVMEHLCEFLGVAFEPAMLAISDRSTYSAPDASRLDSWRSELSPREQALVDLRAFPLAAQFGYAPSGQLLVAPSAAARLWLSLDDRLGRARFSVRRYGVALYLSRFVASRVGPEKWRRRVRDQLFEVDQRFIR